MMGRVGTSFLILCSLFALLLCGIALKFDGDVAARLGAFTIWAFSPFMAIVYFWERIDGATTVDGEQEQRALLDDLKQPFRTLFLLSGAAAGAWIGFWAVSAMWIVLIIVSITALAADALRHRPISGSGIALHSLTLIGGSIVGKVGALFASRLQPF